MLNERDDSKLQLKSAGGLSHDARRWRGFFSPPVFIFVCGIFLAACVKNPITGKREFHMISQEAEIRLGEETKKAIIKEYGAYRNPELQSYINEVGQKIVSVCERQDIEYDFVILDTMLVNAFAVPGAVFLTRGILDLLDDEAELASVIGHEVGHITGFHAVKLIQKSYGYGFLATFAAVAGTLYTPSLKDSQEYAAYYDTLYRGIGLVTAGFLSGYGREFESEADYSGFRYAVLSGYDPDAMLSFFRRMQSLGEENTSGLSLFLRTHPPTHQRIEEVNKALKFVQEQPEKNLKGSHKNQALGQVARVLKSTDVRLEDHFERYHRIVRSSPKKETQQIGSIQENIFEHPELGIQLKVPRRWKMEYSYGNALVSFRSPDGKAQGELRVKNIQVDPSIIRDQDDSIAGVSQSTLTVTSKQWAESIEDSLKVVKRMGREVTYPAGPSYVGTYRGSDRLGRPAVYKILFLVHGEERENQKGFILSCAAPEGKYLDYLLDFERIMRSFGWDQSKKRP